MGSSLHTRRALIVAGACSGALAAARALNAAEPVTGNAPLARWRGPALRWPPLSTIDGRPITRDDFRGAVLVVNLWATWCAPCLQDLPSLDRLRRRVAAQGVEVLAVSIGDAPARIARFLAQTPLDLPIALDGDRALLKAWGVRVLPSTYVFDASGRARFSYVGERDWDDAAVLSALASLRDP